MCFQECSRTRLYLLTPTQILFLRRSPRFHSLQPVWIDFQPLDTAILCLGLQNCTEVTFQSPKSFASYLLAEFLVDSFIP